MKKAIFLTEHEKDDTWFSGGIEGSKRNYKILQKYSGEDNCVWIAADVDNRTAVKKTLSYFFCKTFDLSKKKYNELKNLILDGYDFIFWDCNYGAKTLAKLKKKFPHITVFKFCHDFDLERITQIKKKIPFFRLRGESGFKYGRWLIEIKKMYRIATKIADKIITLTERDSNLFEKYFYRKADFIMPVSLENNITDLYTNTPDIFKPNSVLFVGVLSYYPNIEGLRAIMKVIYKLNANLYIIGKSDGYEDELRAENVFLLGRQQSLDEFYRSADAVIAPIFSGGGMKIKVCEALRYGKWIFGTSEAFTGYNLDYSKTGGLCDSADEFVEKINNFFGQKHEKINDYSIKRFQETYSNDVVFNIFKKEADDYFNIKN